MIADIERRVNKSNTKQKFSILIPTWNNLSYLQLCINSIKKHSTYEHQIIVHINEGKDGTYEWMQQQPFIDYVYSKENIGICYALNAAAQLATTAYIVYINDDMYTCPGWDAALVEEIESIGHNHFFLASAVIEPNTKIKYQIDKNYGQDIASFDEQKLLREYAQLPKNDQMGVIWPLNIVHKNVWDLAGGYSIEFSPGMYSDPDFSMKLWQMGIRLFKSVSKSRVYHFGSKSVKRVKKNNGYYQFISKWRMTAGTFSKYYLHTGIVFNGECVQNKVPFFVRLKNRWKYILSSYKTT